MYELDSLSQRENRVLYSMYFFNDMYMLENIFYKLVLRRVQSLSLENTINIFATMILSLLKWIMSNLSGQRIQSLNPNS